MKSAEKKTTLRPDAQRRALLDRLARVEGQVRGVARMVGEGAYCIDILNQVSAIRAALASFNRQLLENHLRGCVVQGLVHGDDEMIPELLHTLDKMIN